MLAAPNLLRRSNSPCDVGDHPSTDGLQSLRPQGLGTRMPGHRLPRAQGWQDWAEGATLLPVPVAPREQEQDAPPREAPGEDVGNPGKP